MVFPQYIGIFSKITVDTSLALLDKYTSPEAFIDADKSEVIEIIRKTARFELTYAENKYSAIISAAKAALVFGHNKMSKRGSALARRAIHTIAVIFVGKTKKGVAHNQVALDYYQTKCKSKPKMVALGAVMHKVCNIIFAILRDNKEFEIVSPKEHNERYQKLNSAA